MVQMLTIELNTGAISMDGLMAMPTWSLNLHLYLYLYLYFKTGGLHASGMGGPMVMPTPRVVFSCRTLGGGCYTMGYLAADGRES